jgi:hypothetical protein
MFTLRTTKNWLRPSGVYTSESHQVSSVTMVELVGVPMSNGRAGGTKIVLDFHCMCLKIQSNTKPKGLDVDSLVIKHIRLKNTPPHYRAHSWANPYTRSPCHTDDLYYIGTNCS